MNAATQGYEYVRWCLYVSRDGINLWLWGGRGIKLKRTSRLLFSERYAGRNGVPGWRKTAGPLSLIWQPAR